MCYKWICQRKETRMKIRQLKEVLRKTTCQARIWNGSSASPLQTGNTDEAKSMESPSMAAIQFFKQDFHTWQPHSDETSGRHYALKNGSKMTHKNQTCGSGGRAGHVLITGLEVSPTAPPVHILTCPWARRLTLNCYRYSGQHLTCSSLTLLRQWLWMSQILKQFE